MKKMFSVLLLLCVPLVSFGQLTKLSAAAGESLLKQSSKVSPNVSSKLFKARYAMSNQTIQTLGQMHANKVAAIFSDPKIETAVAQALVTQLQEESALTLARLTVQMNKEYAQWADALLRERNPNFLPQKNESLPGLLAISPDPKAKPDITPRFFREWTTTIPAFDCKEMHIYMTAKNHIRPSDDLKTNRYYQKQMAKSNRALLRISKESAQCVSDLVYLLNLYPSLFKDSLTLLAYKLDGALQTEFTVYLRQMIDVPALKNKSGRTVGFQISDTSLPPLKGETFTGFH